MRKTATLIMILAVALTLCACGSSAALDYITEKPHESNRCPKVYSAIHVYDSFYGDICYEADIVQASGYDDNIYMLNKDGTLTRLMVNGWKTDKLNGWSDIESFAVGLYGLLGIKKGGTVVYASLYNDSYWDCTESLMPLTQRPDAIRITARSYESSEPTVLYSDGTVITACLISGRDCPELKVPGAIDVAVPMSSTVYVLMNDRSVKLFVLDNEQDSYRDYGTVAVNVAEMAYSSYGEVMAILFEDGTVQIVNNYQVANGKGYSDMKSYIREQCSTENDLHDIIDIEVDSSCTVVALNAKGEILTDRGSSSEYEYMTGIEGIKALAYDIHNGRIMALT